MTANTVTVFGGTGFLGQAIVRRLMRAGYRVAVAARTPRAVDIADANGGVVYRRVDVRDDEAVGQALHEADAAVNAVALYTERGGQRFDAIHVAGAERIARAAAAAGVTSLVHISGIGVSSASASAYVRARANGEQAVRAAFPGAAVLRPSVLFGPGDAFLGALNSVGRLPVIPLFGDGRVKLQPVHVEDIAAAVEQALARRCAGVYELGGRRVGSYREIVRAVLELQGRRRPLLPVPFPIWRLLAEAMSVLPNPPLTRDQVVLMQRDNVVGGDAATFADLNIEPRGLASVLPALDRAP